MQLGARWDFLLYGVRSFSGSRRIGKEVAPLRGGAALFVTNACRGCGHVVVLLHGSTNVSDDASYGGAACGDQQDVPLFQDSCDSASAVAGCGGYCHGCGVAGSVPAVMRW